MVTGDKISYILIQHDTTNDVNVKRPVFYADYNGGLNVTEMTSATRFDSLKKAKDLATLQNQISALMDSKLKYLVVKEVVSRAEIDLATGEPIVEEEPVEESPEE